MIQIVKVVDRSWVRMTTQRRARRAFLVQGERWTEGEDTKPIKSDKHVITIGLEHKEDNRRCFLGCWAHTAGALECQARKSEFCSTGNREAVHILQQCLSPNLFLYGHQPYWIRAHPNHLFKYPTSKYSHSLSIGISTYEFGVGIGEQFSP